MAPDGGVGGHDDGGHDDGGQEQRAKEEQGKVAGLKRWFPAVEFR